MLKQRPTLNITCSNQYQVRAHVNKVTSHPIESARNNIEKRFDLQPSESDAEGLEVINPIPADNMYHFPEVEYAERGVYGPNPMQRESNATNESRGSTLVLLYGGVRSSSRVCAGVCEGVSIVSCNETCRIDIRSIDD